MSKLAFFLLLFSGFMLNGQQKSVVKERIDYKLEKSIQYYNPNKGMMDDYAKEVLSISIFITRQIKKDLQLWFGFMEVD